MAALDLIQVSNRFLKPTDLSVESGALFVVVGPSGAGKTSLLRVIAGLDHHQGRVMLDQELIQQLPPHRRAVGYVSQDLHLFPHLTLEANLQLAMTRLKWRHKQRLARQAELMDLLRIEHLAGRKPTTFSGGEKQRVALARVLASAPRLLLLDEPFSKLDFRTARYLRTEFKILQRRLNLTTLLVTHDLDEAWEMADSLAVMREGRLISWGVPGPSGVLDYNLADSFLETPNVLICERLRSLEYGLAEVDWAGVRLMVPESGRPFSQVSIKPRDIELGAEPPPGPKVNRFQGRVKAVEMGDDSVRVECEVNGHRLRVETSHQHWRQSALGQGDEVHGLMRLERLKPI